MRRLRDSTDGVAALEFALILPLVVALLLGMLQLGLGSVGQSRLDRAVASGALAYLRIAAEGGGASLVPGQLPLSAHGLPLCAALLDDQGAVLEESKECGTAPAGEVPLLPGEALLVVWGERSSGYGLFRRVNQAAWRVPVRR